MSNKVGVLGDALGQLGGAAKQIGRTVVAVPGGIVKTAAKQVGLPETIVEGDKNKEVIAQAANAAEQKSQEEFVKGLYGADTKPGQETKQTPDVAMNAQGEKSPQEQQKIAQLTQEIKQLHNETYYQPLITPKKRPEEAQEDQERAAERVERLEMQDLQERKKTEEKAKQLPQESKKTEALMGAG